MKIVNIFNWAFLVLCFVFIIINEIYSFSREIRFAFSLLLFIVLSINLIYTIIRERLKKDKGRFKNAEKRETENTGDG